MPASNLSEDLSLLLSAAKEAGEIALRRFSDGFAHWEKADGSVLTDADLAVNDRLHEVLRPARPAYGWLSEETEDTPHRLTARRTFVIDPIDGTRAFANRDRTWALSLAVVEAGQPVAAVIHLPARQLTYTAIAGGGAWLNAEHPLTASARTELNGADMLGSKAAFEAKHWPNGVPPVTRAFRSSLAYRMALVAEGRFEAMATFRPTWDWDVAAGSLIASEAGARVTTADGLPMSFNTPSRQNPHLIAATPPIHQALMQHRR